jgi:hypothetical protein
MTLDDEKTLTKILRAYCDEYEPQNCIVKFPKSWFDPKYINSFKPAFSEFSTVDTVEISSRSGAKFVHRVRIV